MDREKAKKWGVFSALVAAGAMGVALNYWLDVRMCEQRYQELTGKPVPKNISVTFHAAGLYKDQCTAVEQKEADLSGTHTPKVAAFPQKAPTPDKK